MTGSELAAIRKSLGLTSEKCGLVLGYGRTPESAGVSIRKLEAKHDRAIPETVAILLLYLHKYGLKLARGYLSATTPTEPRPWRGRVKQPC